MFIIKKSKIVVDCFTNSELMNQLHPIDYAVKFIPEEWKKLPNSVKVKGLPDPRSKMAVDASTMKKCTGFQFLYQHGFIIPAWTTMMLEAGDREGANFHFDPIQELKSAQHPRSIMWDSLYKGYNHFKITSPWLIREKTGVKFTWNPCNWSNTDLADRMQLVSAVIEFRAQYSSNINLFLKQNTMVEIPAGAPLVHCIPITDKELDLRTHTLSVQEYAELHRSVSHRPVFVGHHKNMLKFLEKKDESKCPFKKLFGA